MNDRKGCRLRARLARRDRRQGGRPASRRRALGRSGSRGRASPGRPLDPRRGRAGACPRARHAEFEEGTGGRARAVARGRDRARARRRGTRQLLDEVGRRRTTRGSGRTRRRGRATAAPSAAAAASRTRSAPSSRAPWHRPARTSRGCDRSPPGSASGSPRPPRPERRCETAPRARGRRFGAPSTSSGGSPGADGVERQRDDPRATLERLGRPRLGKPRRVELAADEGRDHLRKRQRVDVDVFR